MSSLQEIKKNFQNNNNLDSFNQIPQSHPFRRNQSEMFNSPKINQQFNNQNPPIPQQKIIQKSNEENPKNSPNPEKKNYNSKSKLYKYKRIQSNESYTSKI